MKVPIKTLQNRSVVVGIKSEVFDDTSMVFNNKIFKSYGSNF